MIKNIISVIPKNKYFILNKELSIHLNNYISALPWEISGHRLNWSKMSNRNYLSLDFNEFLLNGNIDTLYKFRCFSNKFTVFLHSIDSPCILVETSFVINNFDIFEGLYNATYFFAVNDVSNIDNISPLQEYFLEYDPSKNITGIIGTK